jgi:phage I-like protein
MKTGVNLHLSKTQIALHAASAEASVALCAGMALADGEAPEWIHLLPAGEIRTADGRGPYRVADAAALIAASLNAGNDRLILDENHATDLAAPKGEPAPARAWIVELQARQDGIWGKAEWTPTGRELMAEKAYRAISPAIAHRRDGTVTAILRASLVNRPNLQGLTTLHQETDMNLLEKLLKTLGLETGTSEDALVAAVAGLHQARADGAVALQAQLAPIAVAAGLTGAADATALLAAVTRLKTADAAGADQTITALQTELNGVVVELNQIKDTTKRKAAEAFVDGAIRDRRAGVSPRRDEYIALHIENPARAESLVAGLPALNASHTGVLPPAAKDGAAQLTPEQKHAVALMGVSEADYLKTIQAEQKTEAAL